MLWTLVAVFAMAAFANIMRYAQKLEANMIWAGTVCYLAAGSFCTCMWALNDGAGMGWREAVFGGVSGATILAGYVLFSASIRLAGVGVAQVFERLSMVVAVAISIILWKNLPGPAAVLGLLVAIVSIALLTKATPGAQSSAPRRKVPTLVALLVVTGIGSAVLEAYRRTAPANGMMPFLICQYAVIGTGALCGGAWQAVWPRKKEILCGIVLGLVNVLFYYSCLRCLGSGRAGTVVFPTIAAGAILTSASAGAVLWGERYRLRTLIGMGLAVIALLLINFK